MAKIQNHTGEDRILPWLGDRLVLDGQVVEVPDGEVYAYTQQDGWDPFDDDAKAIHEDAAAVAALAAAVDADPSPVEPSGNATEDEWRTYVLAAGLATVEQLEGMGRNAIRDAYKAPDAPGATTIPPVEPPTHIEPAADATEDDWRAYVLTAGLATADELAGLDRDQIRDTYKHKED